MIVIRLALSALLVILAVYGVTSVWTAYFEAPWTRDARVRADVVQLASQVSGTVMEVTVADNDAVEEGQVILRIDPTDYELAVQRAEADVASATASADRAEGQTARDATLLAEGSTAIAGVTAEDNRFTAQAAAAALQAARAELATAQANLDRTEVRAPVNGHVTNLLIGRGDYAQAGKPILAFTDASSFRVEAFFMETKLPSIPVGADARIRLMSNGQVYNGRVKGITRAVFDTQASSQALLQNPVDSFQWIRLARRIPVTIALTDLPDDIDLVSGQTATVIVGSATGTRTWARGVGDWIDRLLGWR